ncbi:MAG: HAD family hydrolase [Acidobacteria bacterium]|nr:HAD family hydrolase [Acidobacteriota bacterium]
MGVGTVTRAVFLDRDGVLNRAVVRDGKPYPPASAASVELVDGAVACMARLKAAGFLLLVVTNQPDVARGTQSAAELNAINDVLRAALPLDAFFICPHDSGDACDCRKPKPGLILQGAAAYGVDLAASFVIGDRWRDMDAARAAGVRGVWIDYGYSERGPSEPPAATVKSLREAVDWIMSQETSR